jgi:hypothetical protein
VVFPKIDSVGAPPERHANRVVADMMRLIIEAHAGILGAIHAAFRDGSDGNPLGQQRMVRRIKDSAGGLLLDCVLMPGKRGRYKLILIDCAGWNPITGRAIRAGWHIIEGDAEDDDTLSIPDKPWLSCRITHLESLGRGHYKVWRQIPLLITHHSLSRLAQRSNAREAIDLVWSVNAAWSAFLDADIEAHEAGVPFCNHPAGRRLGVSLPAGLGDIVTVICPHDERPHTHVVTTILAGEPQGAAA